MSNITRASSHALASLISSKGSKVSARRPAGRHSPARYTQLSRAIQNEPFRGRQAGSNPRAASCRQAGWYPAGKPAGILPASRLVSCRQAGRQAGRYPAGKPARSPGPHRTDSDKPWKRSRLRSRTEGRLGAFIAAAVLPRPHYTHHPRRLRKPAGTPGRRSQSVAISGAGDGAR